MEAYAYEYPHVDKHNKLSDDWFWAYWGTLSPDSTNSLPRFDLEKCQCRYRLSPDHDKADFIVPPLTSCSLDAQFHVRR